MIALFVVCEHWHWLVAVADWEWGGSNQGLIRSGVGVCQAKCCLLLRGLCLFKPAACLHGALWAVGEQHARLLGSGGSCSAY